MNLPAGEGIPAVSLISEFRKASRFWMRYRSMTGLISTRDPSSMMLEQGFEIPSGGIDECRHLRGILRPSGLDAR